MQTDFCNISCEICGGSAGFHATSLFWTLEFGLFLQKTLNDVMETQFDTFFYGL